MFMIICYKSSIPRGLNQSFVYFTNITGFSWSMDSNPGVSRQCWIMESESRKFGQVVPRSRNLSEDCQSWRSRRHRDWCTRKCSILRPSPIQTKVTSHFSIDSVFVPVCYKSIFYFFKSHFEVFICFIYWLKKKKI